MSNELRTELDIAQRIAHGLLPSPVPFGAMWLVNIRITGTGLAYRVGLKEIVWRDPDNYLNKEFLDRCNGLPVIVNHPDEETLTASSFKERICGTVMLPYIRGEEVWGVCRLYDRELVAQLAKGDVSTSPGVLFNEESGNLELTGDDDNLLIEGVPHLIDHIALVMPDRGSLGVWDKNETPEGVELTSTQESFPMDEENKTLLAQLIQGAMAEAMKPVNERMDQFTARLDAMGRDDSRHDNHDEERDENRNDSRCDENDDDGRMDASRHDDSMSEEDIRAQISRLEKMLHREDIDSEHEREGMEARDDLNAGDPVHRSKEPMVKEQLRDANAHETGRDDADLPNGRSYDGRMDNANLNGKHIDVRDDEKMGEARARADSAFTAIGQDAPIPFRGESSLSYRQRALVVMQKHSKAHKNVDIRSIKDSAALSLVEDAIYADAKKAVDHAINNTRGQLVARVRNDEAGRRIVEYKGDMNAWLSAFKQPGRVMAKLNANMRTH